MPSTQWKGLRAWIVEEIYTCCAFCIAVSALPALAISYVVVRISKHLWLKLLSSRYPHLEFIQNDTVRSLLDTNRNQGIINVLLCVKGPLELDAIKSELIQHVIDRRDRNGGFMFPRLRQLLVSCWGNYAWNANNHFKADAHFIVSNGVYRGRAITDANIQDCVSDIVSKYFPSDQPPWQYIIIPITTPEPQYYILVRVHHLLLTGKKSLNIGDLLLVEQIKASELMVERTENAIRSPLTELFPKSSAVPEFWEKINELLSNSWNEFVSEYDPIESPRALKSLPGAFHVAGLVLMAIVNALREVTKKRSLNSDITSQPLFIAKNFLVTIRRECKRRNLTLSKMLISPLVTMDPRKWPSRIFSLTSWMTGTFIRLPLTIKDEITALAELKRSGHVRSPKTMTWKYAGLVQLGVKAANEARRAIAELYRAPMYLWTDTVRADDGKRHILQSVSLCGRKVASWSRPVSRQAIDRTSRALGVSCTDIALYAATESLKTFFLQTNNPTPDVILATARAATEDFLFTFAEGNGKNYKKSQTGGMVCVALPVRGDVRRVRSAVCSAVRRQRALAAAWSAQERCGALTRALPAPASRLSLNLLSRRYAVSYAEIDAPPLDAPRHMLWGQTLDHIIYWRPPQANISMSLTVMEYADTVRLAVMTDARLNPGQTIPALRWPQVIENLISSVDREFTRSVPRVVRSSLVPQESCDEVEDEEHYQNNSGGLVSPLPQSPNSPLIRRAVSFD